MHIVDSRPISISDFKNLFVLVFCLLLAADKSHAANASAVAFLKEPISVRQVGMGNLSLGEDDILRAWCNPAVLAGQSSRGMVAIAGASMFERANTTFGMATGWRISPKLIVGGLVSYLGVSYAEIDAYGNEDGSSLNRSVLAGGVTGTMCPIESLHLGATVKGIRDKVLNEGVNALAMDVGIAHLKEWGSVGASIRNVGQNIYSATDATRENLGLPVEFLVGALYRYRPYMISGGLEYTGSRGTAGRLGGGIEWWPSQIIALRVGIAGMNETGSRISVGLSALHRHTGLDYAFSSHPLGGTHKVSMSYRFGRAADDERKVAGVNAQTGNGAKNRAEIASESGVETTIERESDAGAGLPEVDIVDVNKEYKEATAHYEGANYEPALERIRRILEVEPNHWQSWWLLGNCHYQMEDFEEANAAYEKSLVIHPNNPGLRSWLESISK